MKISTEHFRQLKLMCEAVMQDHPDGWLKYEAAGLSHERFRWDVLRATGKMNWVCDVLYSYLDDSHIDTALRSIVK